MSVEYEGLDLQTAQRLAGLALDFGRVERATRHQDGMRRESDTTHTVMLGLLACEFAARINLTEGLSEDLNVPLVATLALVHDLVEARCGDVNSFGITPESKAKKDEAERLAMEQLHAEFEGAPWMLRMMAIYETGDLLEAQLVHYLDKCTPKLTHAANGCTAIKAMGVDLETLIVEHRAQGDRLREKHPDLSGLVGPFFEQCCRASEEAYQTSETLHEKDPPTNENWVQQRWRESSELGEEERCYESWRSPRGGKIWCWRRRYHGGGCRGAFDDSPQWAAYRAVAGAPKPQDATWRKMMDES